MRPFSTTARPASFRTGTSLRVKVSNGCKTRAFFKFGKNGADSKSAGIYGSGERDDFDRDEMEHYFNYTGRLAVEQTYDSFNAYLDSGIHPIEVILLWACEEGDLPKVEEVLAAGADPKAKDLSGKTCLELCKTDEVREALEAALAKSS